MIIWINGPFGAGKTTVAAELRRQVLGARLFGPEYVGFVLRRVQAVPIGDFQDLATWRRWVVRVGQLVAWPARPVVVPMTELRPDYRAEIFGGLRAADVPVRQVVLRVPEPVLRVRIDGDAASPGSGGTSMWRLRSWS